jgi:CYTH domain-containing protein
MGTEIERKFLVKGDAWKAAAAPGIRYRQGYLCSDKDRTVRVRVAGDQAWLTVKGLTRGSSRPEFEYPVPIADGRQMLDMCERPLLEKTRHRVDHAGLTWEVDVFEGDNAGLVLAEVELERADQPVDLPPWAGIEVTDDSRYYNVNLAKHPMPRRP